MKKVLILGSTGSIGQNTLDVIKHQKDKFKVVGLTTKSNTEILKKQIYEFKVPYAVVVNPDNKIQISNCKLFYQEHGLIEIIERTKPDIVVNALVGISGLKPLIYAIEVGVPVIALANKESIVVAGKIIKLKLRRRKNTKIIPVDSEHSAIFQCLKGEQIKNVEKVVITASGGPLFKKKIKHKTVEKIVEHPVWKMGKKISVDSATMVNKGFECIEAHYLFDIPYEKLDILIHPQALVHSFVKFIDGSVLACIFSPDMRIPISYALGCGNERIQNCAKKLDLLDLNNIEFYKPDYRNYPLLRLLFECIKKEDDGYLVVFNAANEVLVEKFISGKVKFENFSSVMRKTIETYKPRKIKSINDIFEIDKETRQRINLFC